jgi:FkbM family methyltransferase
VKIFGGISERLRYLKEITDHPLNRSQPWATAIRYLSWNLGRRLLGDVEYLIPLADHAQLVISNHENYATLVYTQRLWDFPEMSFLLHFLRADDLFVDIGANVGGYVVLASAVAGARSLAIEPIPATFQKLTRNIRVNDIAARVDCRNLGLGAEPGELKFTRVLGGLNHVALAHEPDTIPVAVATLDAVLAGRAPAMIKMDVEGYETNVLRGASQTIARPELKALAVELNGAGTRYGFTDDDVHQRIVAHGFRPFAYDPRQRKLHALADYNRTGMNTLYCRADAEMERRLASAPSFTVAGQTI